ncbi:MAG: AI-2E family transporter [Prevotella sp.]|nr:AI-2E family transporter [Prevotella sp.]
MFERERQQITFDSFVRGVLGVIVLVGIVMLLNRLSGVLVPFFLAWLIAYLLFPLVKFFQYRCHMKYRILGILSAFLVVGVVLAGVFMLMIPPMVEESLRVKDLLVEYVTANQTVSNIPRQVQQYVRDHLSVDQIQAIVTQQGFLDGVKATVPRVWDVITQSISIVSSVFTLTMVLLYTLFILLDYEVICSGWQNLLPERYRSFAVRLVADVEDGMNKYFRGQGLVALCVGVLFSIGFLIIGFPMAVGLGMFIGLLNMVPYLQLVGFIPTILLAIVKAADTGQNFWIILLMALAVFAVVQIIQDTFLTPKIMGHVTGLNSAIILLSLSIWGSLLGILGMIIALPLTTLIIMYYQKYVIRRESPFQDQSSSEEDDK